MEYTGNGSIQNKGKEQWLIRQIKDAPCGARGSAGQKRKRRQVVTYRFLP
jgi:hypothetical protein